MSVLSLFDDPVAIATEWADAGRKYIDVAPAEIREATLGLTRSIMRSFEEQETEDLRVLVEDLARGWREVDVLPRQMHRFLRSLADIVALRNPDATASALRELHDMLDEIVFWAIESRVDRLSTIVDQQRDELDELSTPFIEVFDGIAILPLVGTLDSQRTERVMETLLEGIARHDTRMVLVDITGVPAVDTLVAARLVKTVEAARLMGAACILSGLGPDIALAMVRVGVDLSVVETTARLSDALERSFKRLGLQITERDA